MRKGVSANLTASFYGAKYGYDVLVIPASDLSPEEQETLEIDPVGNYVTGQLVKEDPQLFLNFFLRWQNLGVRGLDLGAGVYDILNQQIRYFQPYFGLNTPVPGPSRELVVKATYSLPLTTKANRERNKNANGR